MSETGDATIRRLPNSGLDHECERCARRYPRMYVTDAGKIFCTYTGTCRQPRVVPIVDGWVVPPIGHVFWPREGYPSCTVLSEPVPAQDILGRTMRNVWIKRNDTGEEGWFMYGPKAITFEFTKERK